MDGLDFQGLSQYLLARSRDVVPLWLPGGKLRGREYVIGDLYGNQGDSLSINLDTGAWADFSTSDLKGRDLVSLYANMNNISNGESYKQLSEQFGFKTINDATYHEVVVKPIIEGREMPMPPPDCEPPIPQGAKSWCYRNASGEPIFYVVRIDRDDKKSFHPLSWSGAEWVTKGVSPPRPLYGLDKLAKFPLRQVLVVEGEKAADAAQIIVGDKMVVCTWSNGAQSYKKTDWSPLYGRKILLWPDYDIAGIEAMNGIAELLKEYCSYLKIINLENLYD